MGVHVASVSQVTTDLVPKNPLALAVGDQMPAESRDLVGALDRLTSAAELSKLDPTPLMWLGNLLLRGGYINGFIASPSVRMGGTISLVCMASDWEKRA